jgi:Ala-tRNA(Pro) deacylase
MHAVDPSPAVHERFMRRLAAAGVPAISIDHEPEGNTARASRVRGHALAAAAKSIVARVKLGRRDRIYVIAVVCGHRRVDLPALARCLGGADARFADSAVAQELTGCVSGSVMPLAAAQDLPVVADMELLAQPRIWFNSGRLDHSVGLSLPYWIALARPRMERIALPDPTDHDAASGPLAAATASSLSGSFGSA